MEYTWHMTEENWKNLVADHRATVACKDGEQPRLSADADVYGNCCIGALRADIQHTCQSPHD